MKKLMMTILAFAMVLGLSGCSDAYTNVSESNAELFTVNGTSVTKGDLYPMMLYYSGVDKTLEMVLDHIKEIEVPMDEATLAQAKKDFEEMKEGYGETFTFIMSYYGFKSEEEFYETSFLPQQQTIRLVTKYVEAKFDTLSVTQKPRKVQIMEFKEKEVAEEAYKRVFTDKEDFESVAEELATDTFDGSEMVITTASTLDATLLGMLTETTVSKRLDEVVEGANGKFYVANVIEGDPENFREEACEAIAASSTVTEDATRYFLKQYDFKISDKSLHNMYKDKHSDYIFD